MRDQDTVDDIIVAQNVEKTYDTGVVKVHALRGVNVVVRRGEMVSVMGPSGCGKTTLLNCLAGLDGIDSGRITLAGKPLHDMNDRERTNYRARYMGFVFQFYNLLPVLSAVENVELPLLVSGWNARESRKRALEVLDLVGLSARVSHKPNELSGGQQQRVTIARAIANRPEIIWADEPTGDLDSETSHEIMDLLIGLNRENRQTFVIVTHAPEISARTGRTIRMRDGVVVDDGMGSIRPVGVTVPADVGLAQQEAVRLEV